MGVFTEKQKEVLVHRVALAVRWRASAQSDRDYALAIAETVVKELDLIHSSAAMGRRAITALADKMERTA